MSETDRSPNPKIDSLREILSSAESSWTGQDPPQSLIDSMVLGRHVLKVVWPVIQLAAEVPP
jgi:hypothetical protein